MSARKVPLQEAVEAYRAGASVNQLAAKYGCSVAAVCKTLRRAGVTMRRRGGVSPYRTDPSFLQRVLELWKGGRSREGVARELRVGVSTISLCLRQAGVQSVQPKRERHGHWKGGRFVDPSGYVHIRLPDDHPFASMRTMNGYVLEHRLRMAEHLGRAVRSDETVHHKDGVHDHNDIGNLQLRQGKHGKGVCLQCADCGSVNILSAPIG